MFAACSKSSSFELTIKLDADVPINESGAFSLYKRNIVSKETPLVTNSYP
nr:MAG TPA: hypothetical protein [Bacteriophage sp.]